MKKNGLCVRVSENESVRVVSQIFLSFCFSQSERILLIIHFSSFFIYDLRILAYYIQIKVNNFF